MLTHIRPLAEADAARLAELVQRSRAFLEPWEPVRPDSYFTLEGQAEAIGHSLAMQRAGLMAPFAILDEAGEVAGRINLNNIVRGPFQSASVGYWLDEAATGRGLATAAVGELVGLASERSPCTGWKQARCRTTLPRRRSCCATVSSSSATRRATSPSPAPTPTTSSSSASPTDVVHGSRPGPRAPNPPGYG